MSVCIYRGGYDTVRKSGVGKALEHQAAALQSAGLPLVEDIPPAGPEAKACVVHLNTVLPGAPLAAARAHARGCKVVYYGHSTMEDFRNSFFGSNLLAPLFKRWLIFCYRQGDVVITPSIYSRRILMGYKLGRPIYALSNGIDTGFFHPDAERAARFRARYGLAEGQRCVISVGHWMVRKGLPDFVELARRMPQVRFIWFGQTDDALLTAEVRRAMDAAPGNVLFAGFVGAEELCDAYCGGASWCWRRWPAASPPSCGTSRSTPTGWRTASRSIRPAPSTSLKQSCGTCCRATCPACGRGAWRWPRPAASARSARPSAASTPRGAFWTPPAPRPPQKPARGYDRPSTVF